MKSLFVEIRNVILWSYERGTWQYDLLCLLIIGSIFLIPSKYFGDRDRPSVKSVQANEHQLVASKTSDRVHEIAISDLQAFLQKQHKTELILNSPQEAITLYMRDQFKRDVTINKFEPFMNQQGRFGYKVWLDH